MPKCDGIQKAENTAVVAAMVLPCDIPAMVKGNKPARSAVVVNTVGGERLKPQCPICNAVSWATPVPREFDPSKETFEFLVDARRSLKVGGSEVTSNYPIDAWVCMNCGFLWQRLAGIGKPYQADDDS